MNCCSILKQICRLVSSHRAKIKIATRLKFNTSDDDTISFLWLIKLKYASIKNIGLDNRFNTILDNDDFRVSHIFCTICCIRPIQYGDCKDGLCLWLV